MDKEKWIRQERRLIIKQINEYRELISDLQQELIELDKKQLK